MERPKKASGLTARRKLEALQISIGNQLLALRLFWAAVLCGATAIIEHPAEDHLPSIWRCAPPRPPYRPEQGRFGGSFPKPTDLHICHPAGFQDLFVTMRTTPLQDQGWPRHNLEHCSALKQYPDTFCRLLAEVFRQAHPDQEVQEELPTWAKPSTGLRCSMRTHQWVLTSAPRRHFPAPWTQLGATLATGTAFWRA